MAREESTDFTVVRVNRWSTLYYQGELLETVDIAEEHRLLTEWVEEPFVRWSSGNIQTVYSLQPVTETVNSINADMKDLMDAYFRNIRG